MACTWVSVFRRCCLRSILHTIVSVCNGFDVCKARALVEDPGYRNPTFFSAIQIEHPGRRNPLILDTQ